MKLTLGIWLIVGIANATGFAQATQPRINAHKAHTKHPISTAAPLPSPAQHSPAVSGRKSGSMNDQLNKLERDTAKTLAAKSPSQSKKPAVAGPVPKANDTRAPHKSANFGYQQPVGGVKVNQPPQGPITRKSGLRRRVDSGPNP